jgi:hypothetical protein
MRGSGDECQCVCVCTSESAPRSSSVSTDVGQVESVSHCDTVDAVSSPLPCCSEHVSHSLSSCGSSCSDEKVANRDVRIWHFVIENGY